MFFQLSVFHNCFLQLILANRFKQVINAIVFKGIHDKLIIAGDKYYRSADLDLTENFK